jgi:hypothetical protein
MNDDFNRRKLYLSGAVVLFLIFFGYSVILLTGRIGALKREYLSKQSGLLALEQKQKQAALLSEELTRIQGEKKEILGALLGQQYEDKLQLIVQLEDAAKSLALEYELQVVKELTQEEIDREKELILRSRRGSKLPSDKEEEEKLPGITFEVKLNGPYEGLVKFMEKLQSLPYYFAIERVTIMSDTGQGEGDEGKLTEIIRVTFFSNLKKA